MTDPTIVVPGRPGLGTIQIVVLVDRDTYAANVSQDALEPLLDAFERRAGLTPHARSDRLLQAGLRASFAGILRSRDDAAWMEWVAAGCLWLSLRHWSQSDAMKDGVTIQTADGAGCVVTASIGNNPDAAPGTAWAFMVGAGIHDGRDRLARQPISSVTVIRPGSAGNGLDQDPMVPEDGA